MTKTRNQVVLATATLILLAWPYSVLGIVNVSLNNPGSSTLHEITAQPGSSFTVDINVTPTSYIVGVGFTVTASSSSTLAISDGIFYAPFDMSVSSLSLGALDPVSDYCFASVPTFDPQWTASPIGSLDFAVDMNAQPGVYSLNVADLYIQATRTGLAFPPSAPGPDFIVHVNPEPSSLFLALVSITLVLRRRR